MLGMSLRTGFRIATAALLLIALSRSGVAQAQPEAEQPEAEQPEAEQPEAEQPAPPKLAPDTASAVAPQPKLEPKGPKSTGPLSLRTITRRLDAIKARSERLRARVDMLKDAVLQGGKSATAVLVHRNKMGGQFRLTHLAYTIDGTQVYSERDDDAALHDRKVIDILRGPVAPGTHTVAVSMTYRGHGYGPFKYLNKQTFTVKGSQTFVAIEGKSISIDALAFEREDVPLEQRPAISFKVSKPK